MLQCRFYTKIKLYHTVSYFIIFLNTSFQLATISLRSSQVIYKITFTTTVGYPRGVLAKWKTCCVGCEWRLGERTHVWVRDGVNTVRLACKRLVGSYWIVTFTKGKVHQTYRGLQITMLAHWLAGLDVSGICINRVLLSVLSSSWFAKLNACANITLDFVFNRLQLK